MGANLIVIVIIDFVVIDIVVIVIWDESYHTDGYMYIALGMIMFSENLVVWCVNCSECCNIDTRSYCLNIGTV